MGVHCVGSVPPFALMKTIVWKVIRWAFVLFFALKRTVKAYNCNGLRHPIAFVPYRKPTPYVFYIGA